MLTTAQMLGLEAKPDAKPQTTDEPQEAPKPEKLAWADLQVAPVEIDEVLQVPREVRAAIISALPFASGDQSRPILTSVLWGRTDAETHVVVATDTYRVYVEEVEVGVRDYHAAPAVGTYWLLDATGLREVLGTKAHRALCKRDEPKLWLAPAAKDATKTVTVRHRSGPNTEAEDSICAYVVSEGRRVSKRREGLTRLDYPYASWWKVIPDRAEWPWYGEVPNAPYLADMLSRLAQVGDDSNRVYLRGNGQLDLAAKADGLTAEVGVECAVSHGDAHCAVNARYLRQFVEAITNRHGSKEGIYVTGCIGEPLEPTLWRDPRSGAQYVLMPMPEVA